MKLSRRIFQRLEYQGGYFSIPYQAAVLTVEILTRTTETRTTDRLRTTDRPQIPLQRTDSNNNTSQSNSNTNDKCLSPLTQATQALQQRLKDNVSRTA
jgi:hypothetical protein